MLIKDLSMTTTGHYLGRCQDMQIINAHKSKPHEKHV